VPDRARPGQHRPGAEIAARSTRRQTLDAPVARLGAVNRPLPFSPVYLDVAIPTAAAIEARVLELLEA
jgi:pyruvate/2-oxoglutarate/acetoin dehydrogenase E1 component